MSTNLRELLAAKAAAKAAGLAPVTTVSEVATPAMSVPVEHIVVENHPSVVAVREPVLADAPAECNTLAKKMVWLQKAKLDWKNNAGTTVAVAAPTMVVTVTEATKPVEEVALSPAAKAAAIIAARKAGAGIGAAPKLGTNVMPQISALEMAAKKVQNKMAVGSYAFKDPDAVRALELDPVAVEDKLAQWDLAVETQNPEAKTLLQDINSLLRTYEELAHLMSEEQIGVVVSGSLALAGTEVAALNQAKGKNTTKAVNAKLSSDDF